MYSTLPIAISGNPFEFMAMELNFPLPCVESIVFRFHKVPFQTTIAESAIPYPRRPPPHKMRCSDNH